MTQIPLYYRTDLPKKKQEFKYCCGVPQKYLDHRYFVTQSTPDAYFGLFGPDFDVVFRDKVESDSLYYFPFLPSFTHIADIMDEVIIPGTVVSDIKANRCKILVYNSYEGWSWDWWKSLVAPFIKRYNISLDDFVFVCANLAMALDMKTAYHNFWEYQTKFENTKWLIQNGSLGISQKKHRAKKFICLNRRPHAGRFAGVTLLYPHIDRGYLSMAKRGDTADGYFDIQEFLFQQESPKIYKKYVESNLREKIPLKINDNIDAEIENPVSDKATDKFYDSFLHICPETYQYNVPGRLFFSEKIFKPIMYMQPFVILGQSNSLSTLHSIGYRTFSSVLDESYDNEKNATKRLTKAIDSAVKFFDRPDDELHNDMIKIKDILVHNLAIMSYRSHMMDSTLQDALNKYLHE